MTMSERIRLILDENDLKQKELATLIGVTESYISALISARNTNISHALAVLIEERLGYNATWILTGEGDKLRSEKDDKRLTSKHREAISRVQEMNDQQAIAVLAFMESLSKIEEIYARKKKKTK